MSNKNIDATIFASSHPNIEKRVSVSGIIFSGLILLTGIVMLYFTWRMNGDSSSALNMLLMIAGAGLSVFGLVRFMRNSKEVVYAPTGSLAKEQCLFFDLKHLDDLKQCVGTGKFPGDASIKTEDNGNIRMDVIISQDRKFAAVQLSQFVPYTYNPVTTIQYYTNGEAQSLHEFITSCR